jgi:hypothetical protein
MWMFNMPNQQDFWKDFIDKRVQEALNPTLLTLIVLVVGPRKKA